MAVSVRIEDEAFGDRRYDVLAALLGLPDADCARGKMAAVWRQCTQQQTHILSVEMVRAILGDSGPVSLTKSALGVEVEGGIRICGTRGRIEWLAKLRKNGAKGGRPRKPNGNHLVLPQKTRCEPEPNPPAPAPAPANNKERALAPEALLPLFPDSPGMAELKAKVDAAAGDIGKRRARQAVAPEGYRETIAAFHERYLGANGAEPTWGPKQCKLVRDLIRDHGAAEVQRRVAILFDAPPGWLSPPFDIGTLVQHFDKLVRPASASKTIGQEAIRVIPEL